MQYGLDVLNHFWIYILKKILKKTETLVDYLPFTMLSQDWWLKGDKSCYLVSFWLYNTTK
jgi:hypothetical protein